MINCFIFLIFSVFLYGFGYAFFGEMPQYKLIGNIIALTGLILTFYLIVSGCKNIKDNYNKENDL